MNCGNDGVCNYVELVKTRNLTIFMSYMGLVHMPWDIT